MAIPNGEQTLPPPTLVVKLPVNLKKLNPITSSRKLVKLKIDPARFSELVGKLEKEEAESSDEEPIDDYDCPYLKFRQPLDLKTHSSRLFTSNPSNPSKTLYRPRISCPKTFSKLIDRHPDCWTHFKGLYFYIDYPGSPTELFESIKAWTCLFRTIGREAGWVDHVEVV